MGWAALIFFLFFFFLPFQPNFASKEAPQHQSTLPCLQATVGEHGCRAPCSPWGCAAKTNPLLGVLGLFAADLLHWLQAAS